MVESGGWGRADQVVESGGRGRADQVVVSTTSPFEVVGVPLFYCMLAGDGLGAVIFITVAFTFPSGGTVSSHPACPSSTPSPTWSRPSLC